MFAIMRSAKSVAEELIRGLRDGSISLTDQPVDTIRFAVVVEGIPANEIAAIWDDICKPPVKNPSPDFLAVYPKIRELRGNRFRFVDGNPEQVSVQLAHVLHSATNAKINTYVEAM